MIQPTLWGSDILINTITAGSQNKVKLASLGNGSFVAVWEDASGPTHDIKAQIFNADGSKRSGEFTVNKAAEWAESNPVVTALSDGRFVVAWESRDEDTDTDNLYGRIFNASGSPAGSDFLINVAAHKDRASNPTITATAKGGFAVTYEAYIGRQNDRATDLYTRSFDKYGHALSKGRIASLYTSYDQTNAATISLKDGRYMVFYMDEGRHDYKVYGRLFNANGAPVSSKEIVFSPPGDQGYPSATALSDGRVVVTWLERNFSIKAQIVKPDGSKSGGVFTIYAAGNGVIHKHATITALADGGFAVVSKLNESDEKLIVTTFNKLGHRTSADTVIRTEDDAHRFGSSLSVKTLPDGRLVVSWDEWDYAADGTSDLNVHAQIVDPRGKGIVLTGKAASEQFYGTRFGDVIKGAAGHDKIRGEARNDKLFGGAGADKVWGGTGNDLLSGGTGKDVFVFDTRPDGKHNADRILDFSVADDMIYLDHAVYTQLAIGKLGKANFAFGAKAKDANDLVGYNKTTGEVWYDSNGNQAGGHVTFAWLKAGLSVTHADFAVI